MRTTFKKCLLLSAALCATQSVFSLTNDLLPKPQNLNLLTESNSFSLKRNVEVVGPNDFMLSRFVKEAFAETEPKVKMKNGVIRVEMVDSIPGAFNHQLPGYPNESYSLSVGPDTIKILAVDPVGIKRAATTLMQLALGADEIEAMEIVDYPAFKLRGYLHDVGRSFISIDELKREIDLLSRFKINTFHWHLTENQAWRFGVDKYPELTADSVTTRIPGKYYTPQECRELEAYAAERGVIVIPEIDMPGHSAAFRRAMGHSMQTDEGVEKLKEILESVAEAFPLAPYIHIGGDEERITYPNFLETMMDKVHSLGRKVVVWNPIHGVDLNKLGGFDMTQMWGTFGKLVPGVANIDCRYNYANHFDALADIAGIYNSSIYYVPQGTPEVAGSISAYWNDRQLPTERDIILQNSFYPAVLATAERAWIGGGEEYIETGGTTMFPNTSKLADFADWERRLLKYKDSWLADQPVPYVAQTNINWRITEPFANNGDSSASFEPEKTLKTSYLFNGDTIATHDVVGGAVYLRHVWGKIVPGLFGDAPLDNTSYAWTWVYSPKAQKAGALIEFQNYSRSERDMAPDAGQWDRKGSRLWLNDVEIVAPNWQNAGKPVDNESLLLDENLTIREPMVVDLQEGWNKVFVKLPYVKAPGVRLNKWMFTFVLTDLDGKHALEGLVYSPDKKL